MRIGAKTYLVLGAIVSIIVAMGACQKDNKDQVIVYGLDTVDFDATPYNLDLTISTLPQPNLPADNPLTEAKVALGKMLFYEKALSSDNSISCGSCHNQADGFSDPDRFSEGVGGALGGRQAMAIFNMAWHDNQFFWDGRADLLRDQSLGPIENPLEMNETLTNVIGKLYFRREYRDQFMRAFGSVEINAERISFALENFMMSILSIDSKYDKFLRGELTLSAPEERGRTLFFGEYNEFFPTTSGADCAHCHSGGNFENDQYMNNGLDLEGAFADLGREEATEDPADRAKFKVMSLRNIAVTAPYMHGGRFTTLEEVVDHYNEGLQPSSTLDPALNATRGTGLMLDAQEKSDLVEFLKTLTDETFLNNPEYADPNPN
jgi:cytochrome c peroxidase